MKNNSPLVTDTENEQILSRKPRKTLVMLWVSIAVLILSVSIFALTKANTFAATPTTHDEIKVRDFLLQSDGTQTNAQKLSLLYDYYSEYGYYSEYDYYSEYPGFSIVNSNDTSTWAPWFQFNGLGQLISVDIIGLREDIMRDFRCTVWLNLYGALDVSGCTALAYLNCNNNKLISLDVSGCTSLIDLHCYANYLTSLDIGGCTALADLVCNSNELTELDLTDCTELINLSCVSNQLTTLNISTNTVLEILICYGNELTELDVSGCISLTKLDCRWNNKLIELNLTGCTGLTNLDCVENQLNDLDISTNTALTELLCATNQLTKLDVSNNLAMEYIYCANNQLTELDLSCNTALTNLNCSGNPLSSLDISNNLALTGLSCSDTFSSLEFSHPTLAYLFCGGNKLTSLGLDGFPALTRLYCTYSSLTTLDLSSNTSLTYISVENNPKLATLDVNGCTALETLYCHNNQLTLLNVNGCLALKYFGCSNNQLTELDVSGCAALSNFTCYDNQLTSLNVNGCMELGSVYCYDNKLTSLDLRNARVGILYCWNNKLTSLDVSGQTRLSYISWSSTGPLSRIYLPSTPLNTGGNNLSDPNVASILLFPTNGYAELEFKINNVTYNLNLSFGLPVGVCCKITANNLASTIDIAYATAYSNGQGVTSPYKYGTFINPSGFTSTSTPTINSGWHIFSGVYDITRHMAITVSFAKSYILIGGPGASEIGGQHEPTEVYVPSFFMDVYAPPGMKFGGWYEDAELTIPWAADVVSPDDLIILYAEWIPVTV